MATLTPQGPTASSRAGTAGHAPVADIRRPTLPIEVLHWLRSMLDRPFTSYHLVLGSVALLIIVGLMMVLSASSVNAYLSFDDSYFYVKRQLIFLGVGVLGAFTIMKLPPSTLRLLSWFGVALAAILLILTYTPLGISVNGNRNWLYLGSSLLPK